jgi:hypothetical protein
MSQSAKIETALGQLSLTYQEFAGLSADELRKHWRAKIKAAHPDLPENRDNPKDPGAINAAYDTLRLSLADRARMRNQDPARDPSRYDRATIAPPWQPDKGAMNHRIVVESYRDQNFIKKRIWELSDQSEEIYTIDAFGKTSFEGRTRVYGSQAVFDEMAKAMLIWNANGSNIKLTRAVLVSSNKDDHALDLIHADGKSLASNPIPLRYNPKAGSQYNDKTFQAQLPTILDRIQEMLAERDVASVG